MTRLFAGTPFDIPPSCEDCGKLEPECICSSADKAKAAELRQRQADRLPPQEQTAHVLVQKRKGNRKVTVVQGLTSRANDLQGILSQLQSVCGAGGTVKAKDDLIELQGDHAVAVRTELAKIGFRVS